MKPISLTYSPFLWHQPGPNVVGPLATFDHLEFVLTRDLLASRGLSLVSNFLSYMGSLSQIFNIFIFVVLSYIRVCLSVCPSFLVILGQQCVFQRCQDLILLFYPLDQIRALQLLLKSVSFLKRMDLPNVYTDLDLLSFIDIFPFADYNIYTQNKPQNK